MFECEYFLTLAELIRRNDVGDTVKVRYQKLLIKSYETSKTRYAPVRLSNRDLANLWSCDEEAARVSLRQMRDCKPPLISTKQIGRYEREITLLVAWRTQGSDRDADINAAAIRSPLPAAPETATPRPAQLDGHDLALTSEGVKKVPTLDDSANDDVVQDLSLIDKNVPQHHQVLINPVCTASEGVKKVPTLDFDAQRVKKDDTLKPIFDLLDRIVIDEPNRTRVARLPHMSYEYLLPWAHHAEDHPKLGGGYYVLRFDKADLAAKQYQTHAVRRESERIRREEEDERMRKWQAEEGARLDAIIAEEETNPEPTAELPTYRQDGTGRIWIAVLGELQLQMTKATFDTWVRPTRALGWDGDDDKTLVVRVKSPYAIEWIENRLRCTIERTVAGVVGHAVAIRYEVRA